MPRKRSPASIERGPPPNRTALAASDSPPLPAVRLALFALAALVGLLLYFGDAPPLHIEQRRKSLFFLAAPDELFLMWCGGKLAYFSLLDRWPIALLTIAILSDAWLAGRLLVYALGVRPLLDRLERQVFALAAGLNLLSLYALAIGLAGGLHQRWLFIAPLIVLLAANKLVPAESARPVEPAEGAAAVNSDQVWSRLKGLDDSRWLWWLLAALPFALIIVLGSMLPPYDYDVREYHLQAPKEWYQNGRIDFLPHNIYANMPLGSELTALWGMGLAGGNDGWWWGALAGKTVMACYSLIAAAGLVAFGRRVHSLAAGVVAAVIWLSTPWTAWLATAGYNEGPVALYALLSIFALWLAGCQEHRPQATRLTALGGFLAGSAVGCKYPPLLFLVAPLFVWVAGKGWFERIWSLVIGPWSFGLGGGAARQNVGIKMVGTAHPTVGKYLVGRARPTAAILFGLAVAAASGLWFAKNWVQSNNPTYPLLYAAFDGRTRTPEKDAQWRRAHSPQPDNSGNRFSLRQFAEQIPWNLWRTLWASLAIPPLAAVAWLARSQRSLLIAIAAWIAFVFVAWWLFTHRLDRFLVLALPLASLVAAIGAFAVDHAAWRAATMSFVLLAVAIHFPFVAIHPDNRYFAPLEWLRRDDRALGNQGIRVEEAHRWLNEHARPGERALLLGDAEPFDLELPATYNTCFDDCQFTRIFKGRTREERLAALRAEKIAYVFCSWNHLARYRSPGNYGYTSDYPTPALVHDELVGEQKLLVRIELEADPQKGELFRVTDE